MTLILNGSDGIIGPNSSSGGIGPAITVSNLTALKALISRPSVVTMSGYYLPADGGGGSFTWVPGDSTTPDDGLIIQPSVGPSGRYKRIYDGDINIKWFGAKGDGSVDDLPAFNSAVLSTPIKAKIILPGGTYAISNAIVVNRSGITFQGLPDHVVEIKALSNTSNHFTLGAQGSPYVYNIGIHNITFTRNAISSAGWCIDMCNVGYSDFTKIRIYGDNKQYQGVRVRSCNQIYFSEWTSDNILKEVVYMAGISASVAVQDGNTQDIIISDWTNAAGHSTSTSLSTQGIFLLDDFVGGIWLNGLTSHSHKGYAVYLKGTAPNVANNQLIYIDGLNVEATFAGSAAVRMDNYRGVYCTNMQWVSGKDLNTIHISSGTSTVRYEGDTVALAYVATEAACVFVDGSDVQFKGLTTVGYSSNTHGTGLSIGPNASAFSWIGGNCQQLFRGIDVDVASRTGKQIDIIGVSFLGNNNNSNFNLALAHDLQIIASTGMPTFIRDTSMVRVGGSNISAPLRVLTDVNYVDGIDIRGGLSGQNNVSLTASGNDTNIAISIIPKGTNGINLVNSSSQVMIASMGTTLSNGQTGLYLGYNNGSLTASQVTVGAADSGGVGFRILRVPN